MSSFALPLALFEGTSWQMLATSIVHEERAIVNLDSNLPLFKGTHHGMIVLLFLHKIMMFSWLPTLIQTLMTWRDSRHILAMESQLHLEAIKARLARQSHLATLVHMLSRCESDRFESDKMPSWYMSHNTKH